MQIYFSTWSPFAFAFAWPNYLFIDQVFLPVNILVTTGADTGQRNGIRYTGRTIQYYKGKTYFTLILITQACSTVSSSYTQRSFIVFFNSTRCTSSSDMSRLFSCDLCQVKNMIVRYQELFNHFEAKLSSKVTKTSLQFTWQLFG